MNLLLLDPTEVNASTARLRSDDRRALHLVQVLRCHEGDRIRAGVVRGARLTATVRQMGSGGVELELEDRAATRPPTLPAAAQRPAVDLILALPRPKAFRRVLQAAAALGVHRIDVVNAWRVERSYFASPRLQPADIEEQVRLGCEQGGHTWVPDVQVHERLLSFLQGLPPTAPAGEARVLAHPGAGSGLEAAVAQAHRVQLAIGPEGGWIESELGSFSKLGFAGASIVHGILRTEDAVSAALAQIELLLRLPR